MLVGFALENLLKGFVVINEPWRVSTSQDRIVDWKNRGHDLVWLAKRTGVATARARTFARVDKGHWFEPSTAHSKSPPARATG